MAESKAKKVKVTRNYIYHGTNEELVVLEPGAPVSEFPKELQKEWEEAGLLTEVDA